MRREWNSSNDVANNFPSFSAVQSHAGLDGKSVLGPKVKCLLAQGGRAGLNRSHKIVCQLEHFTISVL